MAIVKSFTSCPPIQIPPEPPDWPPVHQNRCGIFSICARLISPCKKHAHNKPVYPLNPVAVVQAECQGRKYRAGPETKPAPKKSEQPRRNTASSKTGPKKKSCRKKRQASPGRPLRRLRIALPHKAGQGKYRMQRLPATPAKAPSAAKQGHLSGKKLRLFSMASPPFSHACFVVSIT